ncbi:MAG: HD domain-containing protein [Candidatus Eremiobacteraeota bacterium]|nr:HD domain-containing protein [Candidatus Eremiobacteraeota bacterium]
MIGPQWNQEKMIIFARWILVVAIFAGMFFFLSEDRQSLGKAGTLLYLGIAAFVCAIFITLLFQHIKIEQYHYIAWVVDVVIVTLLVKFTGGAFFTHSGGVISVPVNFFMFIFPLLVLSNSVGRPWFSGIGSAVIVNVILAYLFATTPLSKGMVVPWSIYAMFAVFNFALGSFFLFSEKWIVIGDKTETKKREVELEKAYKNLRKEVGQRQKREQELFDKTRKLTTVIQVSRLLGSSLHLMDLFDIIIEKAREEMDSQMAFVMLKKGEELEVVHSIGVSEITKDIFKCRVAPGQGIFADVMLHSKSLCLNNIDHKDIFEDFAGSIERLRTLLVVPLRAPKDDSPLGVLCVANLLKGEEYTEEHKDFLGIFAIEAAMFIKQVKLRHDLEKSYFELITTLAQAIEAKDPYTRGHVNRVADYATRLAKALKLPSGEVTKIEKAAILHDVGKIATPESILNKPGRLTDDEFAIMKDHVVESRKLLSTVTYGIDDKTKDFVAYHHERWDGKGYPKELKGDQIPLGAQIIAVADTFDAMTSDRPYRKGFADEEALKRLVDSAGTQFNPKVLHTFFELMDFDPKTMKIRPRITETVEIQISRHVKK